MSIFGKKSGGFKSQCEHNLAKIQTQMLAFSAKIQILIDIFWTNYGLLVQCGLVVTTGNLRSILKCKWRRRWFISVNPTLGLRLKCGLGCTRAKFVCSGDYFHFLPRRIFSRSMRLLGFQVQLRLSTSRTSPEKWP